MFGSKSRQIDMLRQQLTEVRSFREQLIQESVNHRRNIAELRKQNDRQREIIADLGKVSDEKSLKISELQSALSTTQALADRTITNLQAEVNTNLQRVASLTDLLGSLQNERLDLTRALGESEQELEGLKALSRDVIEALTKDASDFADKAHHVLVGISAAIFQAEQPGYVNKKSLLATLRGLEESQAQAYQHLSQFQACIGDGFEADAQFEEELEAAEANVGQNAPHFASVDPANGEDEHGVMVFEMRADGRLHVLGYGQPAHHPV